MSKKSKKQVRKQVPSGAELGLLPRVGQILLPMVAGIAATKADLTSWVYEQGLDALQELLRADAEELAGKKGEHRADRTHNHWGKTVGELSLGGRRVAVERPRVRSVSGKESRLPYFEAFREEAPIPERVVNQILLGVSTRGYESSLDHPVTHLKSLDLLRFSGHLTNGEIYGCSNGREKEASSIYEAVQSGGGSPGSRDE